jgi:maltose/moltooligosaccharide transporter
MKRLSTAQTIAYSCGNIAAGLFYALNNFVLPLFLKLYTNNDIIIGWLSSTRSFEQSVTQPLIGVWSDRTWTRFGRRAPFFMIMMPLSALFLVVAGLLPRDPTSWASTEINILFLHGTVNHLLVIVVATVFLFSILFNFGIDPYVALLADVTPSEQRGSVNGIASGLGYVGQIALAALAFSLIGSHPDWLFFVVAAAVVVGFAIVAFVIREKRDLLHVEHKRVRRPNIIFNPWLRFLVIPVVTGPILVGVIFNLAAIWRHQHEAAKLLAVKFLYQLGINAAAPFLTLFVAQEIGTRGWPEFVAGIPWLSSTGLGGLSAEALALFVAFAFLAMSLLWAFPIGWLGDRFGKKRVFSLGLVVMGITGMFAAFAATIPQLLSYMVLLGFGNAAISVMFFPYLSDLVPSDRMGEFQGLSAMVETGGVVFSVLAAGTLIDLNLWNLHYRFVFIITGIFLLLGFIAVLFVKAKLDQAPPPAPVLAGPVQA